MGYAEDGALILHNIITCVVVLTLHSLLYRLTQLDSMHSELQKKHSELKVRNSESQERFSSTEEEVSCLCGDSPLAVHE